VSDLDPWVRFGSPSEKQVAMTGGATSYLDRMVAGDERENLIERIDRQRGRMYDLTGDAFDSAQCDLSNMEAELKALR
jgi:hypothetical protein